MDGRMDGRTDGWCCMAAQPHGCAAAQLHVWASARLSGCGAAHARPRGTLCFGRKPLAARRGRWFAMKFTCLCRYLPAQSRKG